MKKFVLLLVLSMALGSCLKHDALKKEANTNFRESDFFTNGDFQSEFNLLIEDISFVKTESTPGVFKCKPVFSIRLTEAYASQLDVNWDGNLTMSITQVKFNAPNEVINGGNDVRRSFKVTNQGSVICGTPFIFEVKLELVAPTTTRIIATTTRQDTIQTP